MYERRSHEVTCPVCQRATRAIGRETAHRLRLCPGCGHRVVEEDASTLTQLYHEDYAGFSVDQVFQANVSRFMTSELLPRIGPGAMVLDVGCGNGAVLDAVNAAGMSATGIDISEAAVASCRRRGLDATVGDFPTHPFTRDAFDAITFWDVVEHLPDPRRFITRAARLLRPGGWLLIKVPGHGMLSVLASALVPRMAGPLLQVPHHVQLFTRASLTALLGADFEQLEWLDHAAMRAQTRGGTLKRRVGRMLVRWVTAASGDGNLVVLARRRGAPLVA